MLHACTYAYMYVFNWFTAVLLTISKTKHNKNHKTHTQNSKARSNPYVHKLLQGSTLQDLTTDGMSISHKKCMNINTCYSLNERQKRYAKNKPSTKGPILSVSIYMKCLD